MKYQGVFFLLTFLGVLSVIRSQDYSQDGDAQVYCGRRLAKALALFCPNGLLVKRSEPFYNYLLAHGGQEYGWPWIAPHRARSLERGKRQAASECCDKPCTMDELLSYCAK